MSQQGSGVSGDGEVIDPPMEGLKSKGLKKGSISLIGAVAIGLAATAPAYSLTGALGHGANEAGYQMPERSLPGAPRRSCRTSAGSAGLP